MRRTCGACAYSSLWDLSLGDAVVIDFAAATAERKKIGHAGPATLEIMDRRPPDESNWASLERLQAPGWRA